MACRNFFTRHFTGATSLDKTLDCARPHVARVAAEDRLHNLGCPLSISDCHRALSEIGQVIDIGE